MKPIIFYGFLLLLFIHYETLAYSQFQMEYRTSKIRVESEYDVWIKIECFTTINYTEFEELLYNNNNNYSIRTKTHTLQVINCPLPDDGNSVHNMSRKLGITSYDHLLLKSNDKNLNISTQHLSNLRHLKRLSLEMKCLEKLPEDLFKDISLKSLQTLDLYTNATLLPRNIFSNLDNLNAIYLGSYIESLGNEVFLKQAGLKILYLAGNKLKHLQDDIFRNNVQLIILELQNNCLETLPQNIFSHLPLLKTLNINGNKFQYLPAKLIENNYKIQEFNLIENYSTRLKLPEFFLSHMQKLEKVEIKCILETLEENIFFKSSSIKIIILNHNNIEFLPRNLLRDQQKLKILDLSYNRLKAIPAGFFDNSRELRSLKLSHNLLTTIIRFVFNKVIFYTKIYKLNNQSESKINFSHLLALD